MKFRACILLFAAFTAVAQPAASTPGEVMIQSRSRQFLIRGPQAAGTRLNQPMRTRSNERIRLDPALVAVSAERVKEAVFVELGIRDQLQPKSIPRSLEPGRIAIHLSRRHPEPVRVSRVSVPGGWTYRLELPLEMTSDAFIGALVQVLLVDLANAGNQNPVDVPAWLTEGFLAHLRETTFNPLMLEGSFHSRQDKIGVDSTARLKELFRARPALSCEELSWPGHLSADQQGLFTPSAHLFVNELMRLDNGQAGLRRMLERLSDFHNWQFAFFDAFSAHFKAPKDVEKWWAVQLAALTGRNPRLLWPAIESISRLDEILRIPVQIQASSGHLPEAGVITLQKAVADWELTREQFVLGKVSGDLMSLRFHSAPEVIQLVESYRSAIVDYLNQRNPLAQTGKTGTQANARALEKIFLQRLNQLDKERDVLRHTVNLDFARHEAERRGAISNALNRASSQEAARR
jgi:hypothetical protein